MMTMMFYRVFLVLAVAVAVSPHYIATSTSTSTTTKTKTENGINGNDNASSNTTISMDDSTSTSNILHPENIPRLLVEQEKEQELITTTTTTTTDDDDDDDDTSAAVSSSSSREDMEASKTTPPPSPSIITESPTAFDTSLLDVFDYDDGGSDDDDNDNDDEQYDDDDNGNISSSVDEEWDDGNAAAAATTTTDDAATNDAADAHDDDDGAYERRTMQPSPAPLIPDAIRYRPLNSIVLKVSLGIVHYENTTKEDKMTMMLMALRTITVVLNSSTDIPFLIEDEEAFANAHYRRHRNLEQEGEQEQEPQHSGSTHSSKKLRADRRLWNSDSSSSSSSYYEQTILPQPETRWKGDDTDDNDNDNDNVLDGGVVIDENGDEQHIAKITLHNIAVKSAHDHFDHDWWEVSAIYTVWRKQRRDQRQTNNNNNTRNLHSNRRRELQQEQEQYQRQGQGEEEPLEEQQDQQQEEPSEQEEVQEQEYIKPVNNLKVLKKMGKICNNLLETSIDTRQYWKTMQTIEMGNQDLMLLQKPYYLEDKGLADITDVGDEYDLSPWHCQQNKPPPLQTSLAPTNMKGGDDGDDEDSNNNDTQVCDECCPKEPDPLPPPCGDRSPPCPQISITPAAGVTITIIFGGMHSGMNGGLSESDEAVITSNNNCTYPEVIAESPLDVEWKTREWVGLGLMATTILFVITLSSVAHFVSKRRTRQRLWGAALTEEGVDDILQVGWRYHEQQQQKQRWGKQFFDDDDDDDDRQQQQEELKQQQQQPQLFLQIYDKGFGPGYNDENSMLKGGVADKYPVNYPVSITAPTESTPTDNGNGNNTSSNPPSPPHNLHPE